MGAVVAMALAWASNHIMDFCHAQRTHRGGSRIRRNAIDFALITSRSCVQQKATCSSSNCYNCSNAHGSTACASQSGSTVYTSLVLLAASNTLFDCIPWASYGVVVLKFEVFMVFEVVE